MIVEAAIVGIFTLLVSADLLEELKRRIATKPYRAQRIESVRIELLVDTLLANAETIPTIEEPFPEVGRDRKDDYLIAYGHVGQADYLVTGDEDLLSLKEVGSLKIVTPRQFADLI
ncbi:MAG: putative toxin-antitoxin system toxin component, PIN family [Herpetosiphonaceae bacterium]|nr:putative toxin-antitoxin system toxin component, PIN family [Herpetosiphonaceae bacterium]